MLFQIADLIAVVAASDLMLVLLALGSVDNPLRVLLGLAMTLFLPGYALVAAIFPDEGPEPLKRLALSVACSLGTAALAGLVLNQSRPGLQPGSGGMRLSVVTFLAALLAIIRRLAVGPKARPDYPFRLMLPGAALLSVTAVLIVLALNVSSTPAPAQGLEGYSSLWMVQTKETGPGSIDVGVTSGEFDVTGYKLELLVNNQVVQEWPTLTLEPGQTWQATVHLPPGIAGRRLDLNLYRLDAPTQLYRHTGLTLN